MTRLMMRSVVAALGLSYRALVTVVLIAAAACGDKNPVQPRTPDPRQVQGAYQLTMTASASCALPAELLQRRYAARIYDAADAEPHDGMQAITVDLSGANMEAWEGAGFWGVRDATEVNFFIRDTYDNDYVFIERLPSGMNLAYSGTAAGSVEQGGIVATFRGRIQHRSPAASTGATCDATDHRMEFVR